MVDVDKQSIIQHKKLKGMIETKTKYRIRDKNDLGIAYWPGVLSVCKEIIKSKQKLYDYTLKSNSILVVSDGSAASSLGNIGADAVVPLVEGKALLYKEFADVNAIPLTINTQEPAEIINVIKNVSNAYGAISLEAIESPKSLEIEEALKELEIPVFNENEHGTAVTVVAALINTCKVIGKKPEDLKVVINGAGAAGLGIARLLLNAGKDKKNKKLVREIIVCDSKGILYDGREGMDKYKQDIAKQTNSRGFRGGLAAALIGADVFVGVSVPKVISPNMIRAMAPKPIIFALAWPTPEIMPDEAKKGGAALVATGRSELPNPILNLLTFPGVVKGCMLAKAKELNYEMLAAAAHTMAKMVAKPTSNKILPNATDKNVVKKVSLAVKNAAIASKVERK